MVGAFTLAVSLFLVPGGLWYGYRAITGARLSQTLSGTAPDRGVVDGEPATVDGTVVVDEPPEAAETAVGDGDAAVAAYLWRARFPESGDNVVDLEEGEVRPEMATFASGIESGSFAVTDGGRTVRIDPSWLVESHDSPALSAVSVGGITKSDTFSTYLWDSPYVDLSGDTNEVSLDRLAGVVERHNDGVDLGEYSLQSRAIREGDTLQVRGEVRVEGGDPVVRGTDGTPLLVSDRGFDAHAGDLRVSAAKYGLGSLVMLGFVAALLIVL
ncbi:hypothetical protein [Halostella salina]|uniref:hypothetical protein n=1 Tax=Halostella salina TaxID=1547897 RepID=UPI0013CEA3CB|nr:hypothetical protein [Halostella salina]